MKEFKIKLISENMYYPLQYHLFELGYKWKPDKLQGVEEKKVRVLNHKFKELLPYGLQMTHEGYIVRILSKKVFYSTTLECEEFELYSAVNSYFEDDSSILIFKLKLAEKIINSEYVTKSYPALQCPVCKSTHITEIDSGATDSGYESEMECYSCKTTWSNIFAINKIDNVMTKDGESVPVEYQ